MGGCGIVAGTGVGLVRSDRRGRRQGVLYEYKSSDWRAWASPVLLLTHITCYWSFKLCSCCIPSVIQLNHLL